MTNEPLTTRQYTTEKPHRPASAAVKPIRKERQPANSATQRQPDWLVITVGLLFLSSMIIALLVYKEY
ncbi:hypothetical protein [Fibrella forsythiae]|uniref:Uncharacterized protein n=1 Tax=Fibrella forsythiae TaxID=2817061 RepID=A0ABS3JL45_9BACT|nr:hypothetical protein [Fibrella forsythiae]MBO0950720.1 hypothetical protein [Fibrella forsythiae]